MGCMCMECLFAERLIDSNAQLLCVCLHRQSDNFLKELDLNYDNCELGAVEDRQYIEKVAACMIKNHAWLLPPKRNPSRCFQKGDDTE